MVHRFAWHRNDTNEVVLATFLVNALLDMGASLILQDDNLDYICVTNLPPPFWLPRDVVPTDLSIFGPTIAEQLAAARQSVEPGAMPTSIDIQHDSGMIFEFRLFCHVTAGSSLQHITIVIDRTAERRSKAAMNALLLEINHRSKNMLAVIQSIANLTERHVTDVDLFSRRLRGRIQALARTQDLVTNSGWKGAMLADIVHAEINGLHGGRMAETLFSGSNVLLSASAAMHVGLALHELAILSIEGAIGPLGRSPLISCTTEVTAHGRQARLVWIDPEQPASDVTLERGDLQLVRLILQRIVPAGLAGTGELQSAADGAVRYELVFPFD